MQRRVRQHPRQSARLGAPVFAPYAKLQLGLGESTCDEWNHEAHSEMDGFYSEVAMWDVFRVLHLDPVE